MITFKVEHHKLKNYDIVSVFKDGRFIAAIYPSLDDRFHILSSHMKKVEVDDSTSVTMVLFKLKEE